MAVRDYSSIYTIEDWIVNEVAPRFFDVSNISLLNVGQFGMTNHLIATVVEDQFEVVDRYVNEILPQKANLPDFIYANAALYGIEDFLARPSHSSMLLYIKEEDILKKSTYRQSDRNVEVFGKNSYASYRDFRIDSDMQIFVDDVQYSIPYDVNIQVSELDRNGEKEISYIATWVMDEINSVSEVQNPYIKVYRSVYDNDIWLVLKLDIYQYVRTRYPEPIITNSRLNIPYFETSYKDELCNFEVFYTPPGSTKRIQLEKRLDSSIPITTPFIYYRIIDDETVRFSFANDDRYFVPDYNSTIEVYMYETYGKKGNFKLLDGEDGLVAQVALSTRNEELAYNRSTVVMAYIGEDSVGGRTRLSVQDIKDLTCEKVLTINSITTDTDLMMFAKNYAAVYQTNPVFIKYRDDPAGREYGCFIRLTDGVDIFPTNTPDLLVEASNVDRYYASLRQYMIEPGKRYTYASEDTKQVVRIMGENEDKADVEYTSIFLTIIQSKPNSVRYYLNTVDKNVSLEYKYINNFSYYNFILSNCSIHRNAIVGEKCYKIIATIIRVDGVIEGINVEDDIHSEDLTKNLKMLIVFDTNEGHYIDMELTNFNNKIGLYTFEGTIWTDDMIDDTRISLTNLKNNGTGEEQSRIVNMTNPSVHFCVFFKYPGDMNRGHDYQRITEIKDYTLCNEYVPYEDEFYFALPMTLTRSHVVFEDMPSDESGFGFRIKQTPMLGYDFIMNNETNISTVTNNLAAFNSFIMGTLMDVTPNFTINIKFFNTYGRSKMFYIDKDVLLDYVHLKVVLGVKFVPGIDQDAYIDKLKLFIKDFVENRNVVKEGTNKIEGSILIHNIHSEFPQVEHMILYRFNEYGPEVQVIELNGLLPYESNPDTVPEYITLKKDDVVILPLS